MVRLFTNLPEGVAFVLALMAAVGFAGILLSAQARLRQCQASMDLRQVALRQTSRRRRPKP